MIEDFEKMNNFLHLITIPKHFKIIRNGMDKTDVFDDSSRLLRNVIGRVFALEKVCLG